MEIVVNGRPVETSARTLEDLCAELGYGEARIATALNGDFVAKQKRRAVRLAPADRVEIVAPRAGG